MPQDIGDNVIRDAEIARISPADAERLSKYLLREGDIVYSRRGDVGRRALVRAEQDGWLCGTGCLRVRPGKKMDAVFLAYYLGHPEVREWIVRHAVGATMPNLNTQILGAVPLVLPSLVEQKAIGGVLGALDDKIAVNERIAVTADKLAKAVFHGYGKYTSRQLSDVADITMGQSPPGETYNEVGEGLPFYQGTRDFGMRYPQRRVWCTAVTRRATENDVLVSVRAPVGHINVAIEECGIGRGLAAVRSNAYPHVLLYALSSDSSIWHPYEAEGTVFGSINKKQLSRLVVHWPDGEQIDALESRLKALDNSVRQATDESRTLATLRDALLPQLISGRLRVRDAEKIVEDAT
nr:restriction endonuclease subunit S [Microbispora rosea]